MRLITLTLIGLGLGCQPKGGATPSQSQQVTLSEAQRKETTDSVEALLQRGKDLFAHPDTTLDPMADFMTTGDVAAATDGQLMLSRDSLRQVMQEPAPPNATMEYTAKKIDVLAPGVAGVTVSILGRQEQGNMVAERAGVWSGVVAVRDGRTRIVQQHQSMQPGTIKAKASTSK